jgi:GH25 family lysozyme M1 (1,4-beta-N-acetylmuramidase)
MVWDHPLSRSAGLDPAAFEGLTPGEKVVLAQMASLAYTNAALEPLPTTIEANGIDIAKYQYYPDFATVAASGIQWIGAKATQGTMVIDPFWQRNRQEMMAHAFRIRLGYHWLTPDNIAGQANVYTNLIGTADGMIMPMCDAEQSGVTAAHTAEWCDRVEQKLGIHSAVYTGLFVAGGTIWKSAKVFNGFRPRILAGYVTPARLEELLAQFGGGHRPDVWQFLGDQGRCPGVARKTPGGPMEAVPCDNDLVLDWSKFDATCGGAT